MQFGTWGLIRSSVSYTKREILELNTELIRVGCCPGFSFEMCAAITNNN